MRRTPLKSGKGLTRKTPLRNTSRVRDGARNTPPAPGTPRTEQVIDLIAAARALQHQAASAALPRPDATPVPDVSQRTPKPTDSGFPSVVRQTILDRDHMQCVRCGRNIDTDTWPGYSLQHRDNRGQGGTADPRVNLPANGLTMCGSATTGCHGWTEQNPTDAAQLGYAVEWWADPATVPVYVHRHGWMRLDANGNRYLTTEPTNSDAHTAARRKDPRK